MLNYRELGAQIRILRRRHGLTQEQLAEMVDVSTSFIGHVERGTRKASLQTIVKIGECLQASLDRLLLSQPSREILAGYTVEEIKKAEELLEIALRMCKHKE